MNTEAMHPIRRMTTEHPETLPGEIFLGNFTQDDSISIKWKTKRAGKKAYCSDGSPFPYQEENRIKPYFAKHSEIQEKQQA